MVEKKGKASDLGTSRLSRSPSYSVVRCKIISGGLLVVNLNICYIFKIPWNLSPRVGDE